jgi:toxin ParE1/3/4
MTRVIVRRDARRHIREAHRWYRNISKELGSDFLKAIDAAIFRAAEWPLAHPETVRSFRRILVRNFPYAVFYQVLPDRIVIVAALHQARDPKSQPGR